MKNYDINELLNQLVALTQVRDETTLEIQLISVLANFNAPLQGNDGANIAIYHLKNSEKQVFSKLTALEQRPAASVSPKLKEALLNCFKVGELVTCTTEDNTHLKLYPIKDFTDKVTSVVELQGLDEPNNLQYLQRESTIRTILELYQNFTKLMHDNERDTLTGLLNRKTFDFKINKVLMQMQAGAKRKDDRGANFYSIAIFDIDHFKLVNDNFGHLIGDEVLLLVAQMMKQSFRDTDPLFRFGGEEFVGIFACTSEHDINIILERFRQKIEAFNFPQVGRVTISTGYTRIIDLDAPTQMIDRADSALYFAKNNGRNRVESYEKLIASGQIQTNVKEGDIELF